MTPLRAGYFEDTAEKGGWFGDTQYYRDACHTGRNDHLNLSPVHGDVDVLFL